MSQGAEPDSRGPSPDGVSERSSGEEIADEYLRHVPWADGSAIEVCVRHIENVKVYHAAVERFYAALGINGTYARFGVLRAIRFSDEGRLPHHELSRHMRASSANISKLVSRLEKEGLVRRVPGDPDRRVSYVELTDEGEALAEQVLPANAEFFRDIMHDFSHEERETFIELLEKFRRAALAYQPDPQ